MNLRPLFLRPGGGSTESASSSSGPAPLPHKERAPRTPGPRTKKPAVNLLLRFHLHLDGCRLAALRLRHLYFKHAILVSRFCLGPLHLGEQRQRPPECPKLELLTVVVPALLLLLVLCLSLQCDGLVRDHNLYLLRVDVRQRYLNDHLALRLIHLNGRLPFPHSPHFKRRGSGDDLIEQTINFSLHFSQPPKGLEPRNSHRSPLLSLSVTSSPPE